MRIAISSGHGRHIRGASASPRPPYLDEVDEARRVVNRVAELWQQSGVDVEFFHDNTSETQVKNLSTIINWHNSKKRDFDVSVHFNAFQRTTKPMGTECLYTTQQALAHSVSAGIAKAGGFINRGAKRRSDLSFLNRTSKPAVLLEVCFVDSAADGDLYRTNFEPICKSIAEVIGKVTIGAPPVAREVPAEPAPPTPTPVFPDNQTDIKCSVFGGKSDPNKSAYPPFDRITDTEVSCALPWRFTGVRPKVLIRNLATGREAMCDIRDIGPWLTDDPYWLTGARPLAETCFVNNTPLPRGPHKGKVGNGAGLDITPAAAKAIGLSGMGQVSWRFASEPAVA